MVVCSRQAAGHNLLLIYWDFHDTATISGIHKSRENIHWVERKKPCRCQGSEVRIGRLAGVFLETGTHITHITLGHNQDLQNSISEGKTPPTLKHRVYFYAHWNLYCIRHPGMQQDAGCETTVFYYALTLCINTKNQQVSYLNCLQQWPFE